MSKTEQAVVRTIYELAKFVGITGDQMRRLLGVMKLCGYEVRTCRAHAKALKGRK